MLYHEQHLKCLQYLKENLKNTLILMPLRIVMCNIGILTVALCSCFQPNVCQCVPAWTGSWCGSGQTTYVQFLATTVSQNRKVQYVWLQSVQHMNDSLWHCYAIFRVHPEMEVSQTLLGCCYILLFIVANHPGIWALVPVVSWLRQNTINFPALKPQV